MIEGITRNHVLIVNYTIAYDQDEKHRKVQRDRRFVKDLKVNRMNKHL